MLCSLHLNGQIGDIKIQENLIENLIESLDASDEFDYNTLYEDLEYYLKKPLNLNEADEVTLVESRLLNDVQISQLLVHRAKFGNLISLHELQSIPSFDVKTIKALEPFVGVGGSLNDYQLPLMKMLANGKSELYLKWRRVLQEQRGYTRAFEDGGYEGDPNKLYVRYKYYHENKLKMGFVAEKDAGETLFKGSNKKGFDYYSAHIHLKEYNSFIKDLIVGDFTASFGQGLILHNGFGAGKSAYVMNIKKGGRALKSYNSVNEANYYRGAAATLGLGSNFQWTIFGSDKAIDGTIPDLEVDFGFESVSSIILDGFHRTQNEIAKKDTLQQTSVGTSLRYESETFRIAVNALHERYSVPLLRRETPINLYRFRGDKLTNVSLDYSYRWENLHFFGEGAMSDNGGMAQTHGLLMGLDKKMDIGFLYRDFGVDYHAFNSNSFAEATGTNNEKGFYTSMIIRPIKKWTISAYFDMWNNPWLRTSKDAPSDGREMVVKIDYYKKRKFEFYIQYKYENKQLNQPIDYPLDQLGDEVLQRLRVHFDHRVSKTLTLRNRFEMSHFKDVTKVSKGYLLYQDVIYKPIDYPFSITGRYALFDTYDGDTRVYAYENDLIYEFYIPQFSGRGRRYYVNLRYDLSKHLTAEFRYAKTILDHKRNSDGSPIRNLTIGSGGERIEGNERTELKAQLRFRF